MLRNSRYWQGTNRKEHKQTIKTFNEKYRDIFHNIKDLKEIKVSTLLLNYLIEA